MKPCIQNLKKYVTAYMQNLISKISLHIDFVLLYIKQAIAWEKVQVGISEQYRFRSSCPKGQSYQNLHKLSESFNTIYVRNTSMLV